MSTSVTSQIGSTDRQPTLTTATPRMQALAQGVAARLRTGATPALLILEHQALVSAMQNPAFAAAMATAFQQEMNTQQPNPAYATSLDAAKVQIDSILKNRIHDTQELIGLLSNAEFLAVATQEAARPSPAAVPYSLPPEKAEEAISHMVKPSASAEPAVHVAASALGHQISHQALANMFRPKGVLRALLVHAMSEAAPELQAGQIEQFAGDWLQARHDAAHETAKGLAPEGALYKEAIRRAVQLQDEKLTLVATPAAQITLPAQAQGRVAKPNTLMLDAI